MREQHGTQYAMMGRRNVPGIEHGCSRVLGSTPAPALGTCMIEGTREHSRTCSWYLHARGYSGVLPHLLWRAGSERDDCVDGHAAVHNVPPRAGTADSRLRPIPTYGRFPRIADSHLRPIPAYRRFPLIADFRLRRFPLTDDSHLLPIPTYGRFPLTVHSRGPCVRRRPSRSSRRSATTSSSRMSERFPLSPAATPT
jgi:hypothetical protein